MNDFSRMSDMAHEHQRDLLQAAQTERLLRDSEPERVGFRDRVLLAGSDALIAFGRKLRAYAHQELVIPCDGVYPVNSALPRP